MALDLFAPPVRVLEARFYDVEHMCASVRSWNLDFRPLVLPANADEIGSVTQHRFGKTEFAHAAFRTALDQRGAAPEGLWTFVVQGARMRRLWWRGHEVGPSSILVYPPGSELRCYSGPDFAVDTISLREETVEGLCHAWRISVPVPRRRPEVFRPTGALLSELRVRLCLLRDGVTGPADPAPMAVVEALVTAWLRHAGLHAAGRPSGRERDEALRRCLAYLDRADVAEPTAARLREVCGASERTLQYAFRERFGLSPLQFLRALRLTQARARLRAATDGVRVGDVAAECGFWHVGQFAKDYRAAFGETPSNSLRGATG